MFFLCSSFMLNWCRYVLGKHPVQMWYLGHPQRAVLQIKIWSIFKWVQINLFVHVTNQWFSLLVICSVKKFSLSQRKTCLIFVLFSATSSQSRELPVGGPGSCRLDHDAPSKPWRLKNGRYCIVYCCTKFSCENKTSGPLHCFNLFI